MTNEPGSPDTVVVGGGVVGAAIAFQLARLGARVTLLEREKPAAGATGQSGALVRTHYPDAPEATVARAALHWFANWGELVGGDSGFVRTGFLQFVTPADHDLLRRNTAMVRDVGVETRIVDAEEIRAIQPGIVVDDDTIAAYEPNSGYADPVATTISLIEAARRHGAEIRLGTTVRRLRRDGDRVVGVETDGETIDAGAVV
ncbi:MAG: FAD-binding oxidoreductase, partial [Actinomycetia bacterium]|nr:FAD-binding oxidoreductase [Actinomycetes bacterium]